MKAIIVLLLCAASVMGTTIFPSQPQFQQMSLMDGLGNHVSYSVPLPIVSQSLTKETQRAPGLETLNQYNVGAINGDYTFDIEFIHTRTIFSASETRSYGGLNLLVDEDTECELGGSFDIDGWSSGSSASNYLRLRDTTTNQYVYNKSISWSFNEDQFYEFPTQSVTLLRGHSYSWGYSFIESASSYNLGATTTGNFYLHIPEPATAGLLILGGLISLRRKR